ncbi:MAG: hypothetical protein Q4F05_06140 [bacterium]|nr:hypothetical protein [bacterium]
MMAEMTLLKVFYDLEKTEHKEITTVTHTTTGMTKELFDTALTSLQEHGYLTITSKGAIRLTKKGHILGKEL